MIEREEHQLILDVAVKYYLEDKTQNQIAKELYISRSKVSRLLKKAKDNRIVEININYVSDEFAILKSQTRNLFDVKNVFIIKTVCKEMGTLKEAAKVAAKELELCLHDGFTLGISWGRHIGMMSKYLMQHDFKDIRIVEVFGAFSFNINQIDNISVGRKICEKLNAHLFPIPAPIHIFDPTGRQEVMNSVVVKNALEKIEECDLIVSSIGTVESDKLQALWHHYLSDEIREEIIKDEGVGFILAHFFDKQGKFIKSKINDSVIGIPTEKISDKKIFVIATGIKKAKALLGALRGGLIDTLVTDEATIRLVIKMANEEN